MSQGSESIEIAKRDRRRGNLLCFGGLGVLFFYVLLLVLDFIPHKETAASWPIIICSVGIGISFIGLRMREKNNEKISRLRREQKEHEGADFARRVDDEIDKL